MGKEEMLRSVESYLLLFKPVGNYEKDILEVMSVVDRKNFISQGVIEYAYVDSALPIEKEQTISQPSTVARMLQLLELKKGDKVLEVGTGSGWNVCLMSYLVGNKGSVLSLEIVSELAEKAKKKIEKLRIKNVKIFEEDFRKINERFDKIIFTAGIAWDQEIIIENFASEHLESGGILICPRRSGKLIIFKNINGKIKKNYSEEEYVFVPLIL